jgi:hypothetical protein
MNEQFRGGFWGIILKILRLEDFLYNVYSANQFQTTFAPGGGGGEESVNTVDVTVNSKEDNS